MQIFVARHRVADGVVMVPVLMLMAIISALSLPYLNQKFITDKTRITQDIDRKLAYHSEELAALSGYQLRLEAGVPSGLHLSVPPADMNGLVSACQNRLRTAAPIYHDVAALDGGEFGFMPVVTRAQHYRQTSFFRQLDSPQGIQRFLIVSCSYFNSGSAEIAPAIAGVAAEHVLIDGSWHLSRYIRL